MRRVRVKDRLRGCEREGGREGGKREERERERERASFIRFRERALFPGTERPAGGTAMRRDFTALPGIERRNRNPKLHARQAAPKDCLLYVKGESLAAERPSATPSRPHGRTGRLPRGARFHPILPREARETALAACPLRGPATARSGLAGLPRGHGRAD